jgi:ABC-type protease/lipase transport system fused ATPase/permease subunit
MADVLEGLRVLQVVRHHGMLGRGVRIAWRRTFLVLVVFLVAVLLVHKVLGPLVLVGAAILRDLSARGSFSAAQSRREGAYILVPANRLVDVARRKLVQLLVVPEDDNGHIN